MRVLKDEKSPFDLLLKLTFVGLCPCSVLRSSCALERSLFCLPTICSVRPVLLPPLLFSALGGPRSSSRHVETHESKSGNEGKQDGREKEKKIRETERKSKRSREQAHTQHTRLPSSSKHPWERPLPSFLLFSPPLAFLPTTLHSPFLSRSPILVQTHADTRSASCIASTESCKAQRRDAREDRRTKREKKGGGDKNEEKLAKKAGKGEQVKKKASCGKGRAGDATRREEENAQDSIKGVRVTRRNAERCEARVRVSRSSSDEGKERCVWGKSERF